MKLEDQKEIVRDSQVLRNNEKRCFDFLLHKVDEVKTNLNCLSSFIKKRMSNTLFDAEFHFILSIYVQNTERAIAFLIIECTLETYI